MTGKGTPRTRDALVRENERLKVQLEAMRTSRVASNVTAILRELIKYGFPSGAVVWCTSFLAGKATKLDAAIDLCSNLKDVLAEVAPRWWLQVISVLIVGAVVRSNARYRKIVASQVREISSSTKANELAVDPNRSSSGLGEDGDTHQRDRIW